MPLSVRLKFWLFEHYWWILIIAVASAICALLAMKEQVATIATVVGALLSVAYFLQKQKLEELRVFREIFKECNARYDVMNEDIAAIGRMAIADLTEKERSKVIDYLNLCGEEYLYFKRGYIEPSVWQAWNNGMKAAASAQSIRSIWDAEKKTGSYYDLPL